MVDTTKEKKKVLRFDKDNKLIIEELNFQQNQEKQEKVSFDKALSLTTELGLSIALPIAGGAFLGNILDKKFTTQPRMTLFFIFLGLIIAAVNFYKIYKEMFEK